MRKLICFVITVFGLLIVNAQDVKFGFKTGLNIASITGDKITGIGFESRTDFHVGGVVEIVFSDKFSFQPELMHSEQGTSYDDGSPDTSLNYINMPLMAKYYLTDSFSLEVGPQVGLLFSAKNKGLLNVEDTIKTFDFGLNFGLGYKLQSGLNFGVRYNVGLSNVNDIENYDNKNQNSVFQLSIGYFFN